MNVSGDLSRPTLLDLEGRGIFVATCPICGAEFESPLPNRLCDRCAAEVIARDTYQPADLRFVGILAGVLTAVVFSIPGIFLGHYIGGLFGQAWNGCLIGMIGMSLAGLATGYRIGPRICLQMETARRNGRSARRS